MSDKAVAPGILRMDAGEIDLLDQENALLELEDIVDRVRLSYELDIEEGIRVPRHLGCRRNAEATKLLASLKAAVERAGPAIDL